jgi:hypothetical protein
LGNVDEIVITGMWRGISAEEYGSETREKMCEERGDVADKGLRNIKVRLSRFFCSCETPMRNALQRITEAIVIYFDESEI